ncbi:hypothetical protein [Phyllobacterium endophyticum]|nr:hypothetical protein [Phyllobacterium endophyticum]
MPAADYFMCRCDTAVEQYLNRRDTVVFSEQSLQGTNIDAGGIGNV